MPVPHRTRWIFCSTFLSGKKWKRNSFKKLARFSKPLYYKKCDLWKCVMKKEEERLCRKHLYWYAQYERIKHHLHLCGKEKTLSPNCGINSKELLNLAILLHLIIFLKRFSLPFNGGYFISGSNQAGVFIMAFLWLNVSKEYLP
jgi:hypothetical protein